MRKGIQYFISIIFILSVLNSCVKDDVEINFNELTEIDRPLNFEGPLIDANLLAIDFLRRLSDSTDGSLKVDSTGLIYIEYKDSILTKWDSIVDFAPLNKSFNIPLNQNKSLTAKTVEETIPMNATSDQRFDSLIVEESVMQVSMEFPNNYSDPVSVTFPEITKNGDVLSFELDKQNSSASKDLKGYRIIFSKDGTSSNITMQITINDASQGGQQGSSMLNVHMEMDQLVPEIMFGYFGQKPICDKQTALNFGFFDDFKFFEYIEFTDIKMLVEYENYYGLPFEAIFSEIYLRKFKTNESLTFDPGYNVSYIEGAERNNDIIPVFYSDLYTEENSNIEESVNLFPDKVDYRMQININPDGEQGLNFVTKKNRIAGNVYLTIPMWMRTDNYVRYDTLYNFNLIKNRKLEQIELIETGKLYFSFLNGFPFEVETQIYVANDDYSFIDSLFVEKRQLLETGVLDADYHVIDKSKTEVTISLTNEQLVKYKKNNVGKLILHTKSLTADKGKEFVKIFKDYGVNFEMNAKLISSTDDK